MTMMMMTNNVGQAEKHQPGNDDDDDDAWGRVGSGRVPANVGCRGPGWMDGGVTTLTGACECWLQGSWLDGWVGGGNIFPLEFGRSAALHTTTEDHN